jgi:Zn-dependent protease
VDAREAISRCKGTWPVSTTPFCAAAERGDVEATRTRPTGGDAMTGDRPGPLRRGTLRLGTVEGVPVLVHWTLLALVALLGWGLSAVTLPALVPAAPAWAYAVAGFGAAAVLVAGLLAHELAHAVVARRNGIPVQRITLWVLGGLAELGRKASDPDVELRVAVAGPAVSVLVGVALGGTAAVLAVAGMDGLPVATLTWLAGINVLLGLFNLLPAAPLDGGRILHALLWKRRGDAQWAAAVATSSGRALGIVLVALGLSQVLVAGSVGGLWTALIGWFVMGAATAEQQQALQQHTLAGVLVRDVMSGPPETAPPDINVTWFVDGYLLRGHHSTFPVVSDGLVVGLVTLRRVKRVPPDRRSTTMLRDIACPVDQVPSAAPEEPLLDLLPRLEGSPDGRALVFDGGHLVGVVSPSDVSRAVQHAALRRRPPGRLPAGHGPA